MNVPHSKCGVRGSVPGVRIPPSPPGLSKGLNFQNKLNRASSPRGRDVGRLCPALRLPQCGSQHIVDQPRSFDGTCLGLGEFAELANITTAARAGDGLPLPHRQDLHRPRDSKALKPAHRRKNGRETSLPPTFVYYSVLRTSDEDRQCSNDQSHHRFAGRCYRCSKRWYRCSSPLPAEPRPAGC